MTTKYKYKYYVINNKYNDNFIICEINIYKCKRFYINKMLYQKFEDTYHLYNLKFGFSKKTWKLGKGYNDINELINKYPEMMLF